MSNAAPAPSFDLAGYGLAIAGASLFSTKGILIKLAYATGIGPETALAIRMVVAFPVFLGIGVFAIASDPSLRAKLTPGRIAGVAGVGLLGYFVSSYLDFAGLAYVSAQYERLVLFTYPFLSLAFGVWFFGDRMSWRVVPALVVSYLGLLVVFLWNLSLDPDGLWIGTGLVLASAVTYALYLHLAKRQMNHVGARLFTCVAMGSAAIAAVAHNTIQHGAGQLFTLSGEVWLYGLALGLLATVFPAFFINTAISRIGARATAATGSYGPIVTILLAVWILGEPLTPWLALGAALVVGGSIWFGRIESRPQPLPKAG